MAAGGGTVEVEEASIKTVACIVGRHAAALVTMQSTKVCISLGIALTALGGCGGGSAGPAPPVNQVARKLVNTGFFNAPRSAVVFVEDGKRTFAAAYGPRARSERRFCVGSITKTFTSAIVLPLVH